MKRSGKVLLGHLGSTTRCVRPVLEILCFFVVLLAGLLPSPAWAGGQPVGADPPTYSQDVNCSPTTDNNTGYSQQLQDGNFVYTNESVPYPCKYSKETCHETVTTVKNIDGSILFNEVGNSPVGHCAKLPFIFKLPIKMDDYLLLYEKKNPTNWLIVMCNGYQSKHEVLKIFLGDTALHDIRHTTLHFYHANANISDLDGDGSYESEVQMELFFQDQDIECGFVWKDFYPIVLKLFINDNQINLHPVFGKDVAYRYLRNYQFFKEHPPETPGPILAALFGSQDKSLIPSGVDLIQKKYGLSTMCLIKWTAKLQKVGYPTPSELELKGVNK